MHTICKIQGKQYPVEVGAQLLVNRINQDVGSEVVFDSVLCVADENKPLIGQPYVKGAVVKAEIQNHVRGKKVVVFKHLIRKNSRKKAGFRHEYTQIKITAIEKA